MRKTWISSFLAAGLVATLSTVASAGVDGIITAGEYDHQWTVQGWDKQAQAVIGSMPTATLYMRQDASNNLYVALVLPLNYCDNSYGGAGFTSTNWTNSLKTTHNFSDLTGSDEAQFFLKRNNGTAFFDGDMDYLNQNSSSPVVYGSGGFSAGEGSTTATAGATAAQQLAMVGGAQSSMGYNFLNGGNASYATHSPTITSYNGLEPVASGNPNWEYEVVYEFEILATAAGSFGNIGILGGSGASSFLTNGFSFELTFVHASPNMFNDNNQGYHIVLTPSTPPAVPLPAAAWMGGLMMLGIVGETIRRRRRNALLA